MIIGVKITKDDMKEVVIFARETLGQQDGIGVVRDEVDSRREEISSEKK